MIATTRPLTNAASYTTVSTSAGPLVRTATPGPMLPPINGQQLPNSVTPERPRGQQLRLIGNSNRRVPAPRSHGVGLTP